VALDQRRPDLRPDRHEHAGHRQAARRPAQARRRPHRPAVNSGPRPRARPAAPPGGVAISGDEGKTWETFPVELGKTTQFFTAGATAVDKAGTIYQVAAGGYQGGGDREDDGEVTLASFDRKTKKWSPVTTIARRRATPCGRGSSRVTPGGSAWCGWSAAATSSGSWPPRRSTPRQHDPLRRQEREGCPALAGRRRHRPPGAQGRHLPERHDLQRRRQRRGRARLGEYVTVALGPVRPLIAATADTMLKNPLGGTKSVSNPLFLKQTGGPSLYAKK
jgi:hypothetical protein